MEILCAMLAVAVVVLWLRIRELETRQTSDASYAQWWLMSMEERKEDTHKRGSDDVGEVHKDYNVKP